MKKDELINSIGRINDDMIEQTDILRTNQETNQRVNQKAKHKMNHRKTSKGRKPMKKWLATAASILLILGIALTVDATTGSVSNLLAPLLGSSRTDIIDSIGIPLDASVSADGYTLTADAVFGDRHNVFLAYTLTREDGQPIPDNVFFEERDIDTGMISRIFDGSSGSSMTAEKDANDPSKLHLYMRWHTQGILLGRHVTSFFSDLSIYVEGKEYGYIPVAKGPWELSYTLRYEDATQDLPVHQLRVTDENGRNYEINKLSLSPIGFYAEGTLFDYVYGEERSGPPAVSYFKASVKLCDGTIIPIISSGSGLRGSEKEDTARIYYSATFEHPIPIEEIEALILCDTEYPIRQKE